VGGIDDVIVGLELVLLVGVGGNFLGGDDNSSLRERGLNGGHFLFL